MLFLTRCRRATQLHACLSEGATVSAGGVHHVHTTYVSHCIQLDGVHACNGHFLVGAVHKERGVSDAIATLPSFLSVQVE